MAKPDQVQDDRLRALFEQAQGALRTGKATEAVHTLVEALYRLLELKPELSSENPNPSPALRFPS